MFNLILMALELFWSAFDVRVLKYLEIIVILIFSKQIISKCIYSSAHFNPVELLQFITIEDLSSALFQKSFFHHFWIFLFAFFWISSDS